MIIDKLEAETQAKVLGWESYWSKTSQLSTPIVWDCSPEVAVGLDLPRFKNLMSPDLPIIDFACGNGTQTRFLANNFSRVIGVDISKSAIEMAQRSSQHVSNVEYRVLNSLDPEQAAMLHYEVGDSNIYMRAGFHHISQELRPNVARSLELLLGEKGIIYLMEFGANATSFFNSLLEELEKTPEELELVFKHGIKPGSVRIEDIVQFFPNFDIIVSGEDTIYNEIKLPNSNHVKIPSFYAILKRK